MIYVVLWAFGAFIAWAIVRGGTRHDPPAMRISYPERPVSESSGCESSSNETWDGADVTGPAPCP